MLVCSTYGEPITDIREVEKSRYLLQSTEQGAGQLLANSQAPQGVRITGSCMLQLMLRGVWSSHIPDLSLESKILL